jgi:integrase
VDERSERLTLHGLRHTHISGLFVLGEEAGYVADQVGHSDAGFTPSRYRKRIERRDGEPERLLSVFFGDSVDSPEASEQSTSRSIG